MAADPVMLLLLYSDDKKIFSLNVSSRGKTKKNSSFCFVRALCLTSGLSALDGSPLVPLIKLCSSSVVNRYALPSSPSTCGGGGDECSKKDSSKPFDGQKGELGQVDELPAP